MQEVVPKILISSYTNINGLRYANEKHISNLSVQFSSVAHSCLTLCDPMNHSTPGLPIHHQLPESTQTHAHRVGDAIQPSDPLSSPSPPAPISLPASGSFPVSQLFVWDGPKYWSFSFSTSPSNEHSGLISFRKQSLIVCKSIYPTRSQQIIALLKIDYSQKAKGGRKKKVR